jgi:AraC-like DNA-binding protein
MLDTLYADSFMWAFGIYMMSRYGDLASHRPYVGGLSTWQERLAKELIEINLADGVALEELARCCDLRVSQFAHAFRRSVGLPPYQWLIHRRVARATDLLRGRRLSLAEIANQCGFADQAHFTRVFHKRVGVAPAAWRKQN